MTPGRVGNSSTIALRAKLASSNPPAAAGGRENQALREKLAEQTKPARADREPHRHFMPPRERAHQQQIADIRARDQQDEAGHHQRNTQASAAACPRR